MVTPKKYNNCFYPSYSKARSFVQCINNSLEKCNADAKRQMEIIGWDDETKRMLLDALECYDRKVRSNINWKMKESVD